MKTMMTFFLLLFTHATWAGWQEEIIANAKTLYESEAKKEFNKPIEFVIEKNASVSASAKHDFDKLSIVINTGLLESSRLSPDSFRMIICHELGHLFGGAPRKNVPPEWDGPTGSDGYSLMSSEGQADYYASTSCLQRMIALEKKSPGVDLKRVGPVLKHKCQEVAGKNLKDLEACYRTALAGLDFLKLTFDFSISCELEDDGIASQTMRDIYPDRQCRLDTIVNGALCPEILPLSLDPSDSAKNTCQALFAKRPQCWFID